MQFFWWGCSMRPTEKMDDRHIQWLCCLCSWQLTIGPHSLSLWPSTVDVILHHRSLVTHVEDKTIGWYCHIAGQQQLGAQRGLHKISNVWTLRRRASTLFVQQVHLLQGAQITVAHIPVTNKVDCHEEFYSFTNQLFVSWCLGAYQEWWRLLAQSTRPACADTIVDVIASAINNVVCCVV